MGGGERGGGDKEAVKNGVDKVAHTHTVYSRKKEGRKRAQKGTSSKIGMRDA